MNESNKCQPDSFSSNEKEVTSNDNNCDNPLSNLCKYLDLPNSKTPSKENVELSLEVEINESLKRILGKNSGGSSELLDVTIIRPSESDTTHETTVALNKDEVRDFISLVEQHKSTRHDKSAKRQQKVRDDTDIYNSAYSGQEVTPKRDVTSRSSSIRPRVHDEPTRERKIHNHLSEGSHPHKNYKNISDDPKQVYATVNTFDKLKTTLACQKKHDSDQKSGTPCLCQHCGIVGVLVQSQKGPVAPFPPLDEDNVLEQPPVIRPAKRERRRELSPGGKEKKGHRSVDLRKNKSDDQLELLKEINHRIKMLEKRIAIQEQTAVPKEYLKHILHKILTQYNFKPIGQASDEDTSTRNKMKNSSTQYSCRNLPAKFQYEYNYSAGRTKEMKSKKYQVQTVLQDSSLNNKCFFETKHEPRPPPRKAENKECIDSSELPKECLEDKRKKNYFETEPKAITPQPCPEAKEGNARRSFQQQQNKTAPPKQNAEDMEKHIFISRSRADLTKDKIKSKQKDYFWLWGEEVVRPGCDLKNKILNLLEEKINTDKKEIESQAHQTYRYNNYREVSNVEIKIECEDDSTILDLTNMTDLEPFKPEEYYRKNERKPPSRESPYSTCTSNNNTIIDNKINQLNGVFLAARPAYPFDVKRAFDDSLFRKNIEACKEKNKDKPPLEEKFFNTYACQSFNTESKTSLDYITQRLKNEDVLETGIEPDREAFINQKFNVQSPIDNTNVSYIKTKLNSNAFRAHKDPHRPNPHTTPINVTYVNPRIRHWSEDSSASEEIMQMKNFERKDKAASPVRLEEKESLIYKLDFLKNLAKNKSVDQSRVLKRIWNQAKNTALSKKDAVYIKIPIRTINAQDPRCNVVEMELTLEELETVVHSAEYTSPSSRSPHANVKPECKSSSEVDIAQIRHQEMKLANRELLNRRQRIVKPKTRTDYKHY